MSGSEPKLSLAIQVFFELSRTFEIGTCFRDGNGIEATQSHIRPANVSIDLIISLGQSKYLFWELGASTSDPWLAKAHTHHGITMKILSGEYARKGHLRQEW